MDEAAKPASKGGASGARHTIVFAQGLFDLASAWADAEGRTVGSVLTYALETGLRTALQQGVIPDAAVSKYRLFCDQRRKSAEDEREYRALREERILKREPETLDEYIEMREREETIMTASNDSEPRQYSLHEVSAGLADESTRIYYEQIKDDAHKRYKNEWKKIVRAKHSIYVDNEVLKIVRDQMDGLIPLLMPNVEVRLQAVPGSLPPPNSSRNATTAANTGAHRSNTASRSGVFGSVARPSSERASSCCWSSAKRVVRSSASVMGTQGRAAVIQTGLQHGMAHAHCKQVGSKR